MEVTATIQARMGSTRLPGKVLMDISGKPMLLIQIERIRRSRLVDKIVVGTSTSPLDDEILEFCNKNEVECFRGSEDDVLGRISSLLETFNVDVHVECFGDSPLVDPQLIDEFIGYYLKFRNEADYFSSALETTYPPGLEVSVYPAKVLIEVNSMVRKEDPLREHAGYNITRFPKRFRLKSLTAPPWFNEPELYLEVDTQEDINLLRYIINYFLKQGKEHFGLSEILSILKVDPNIQQANMKVERRWKALRYKKNKP